MKKLSLFNSVGAAGLLIAGASFAPGCSSNNNPSSLGQCAAGLDAKANAFKVAVDALVKVSGQMKGKLAVACKKIATDLGQTPPATIPDDPNAATTVSDDDMKTACNLASTAIQAKAAAAGSVSIAIEGGKCEVNAQAQFDCEAKCDVDGKCQPPSIEARCTPAELSGICDAECKGSAVCEGSATVAAQCQGSCSGSCTGTCDAKCTGTCQGTCNGTCDGTATNGSCAGTCEGTCTGGNCQGTCSGSCTGTCTGDCTLASTANINCGANVTCKGGCTVTYKQPQCEAELQPLQCDIDAECKSGCDGQGSFEATCTPPTVKVVVQGDATLQSTLQANMPAVLAVVDQAKIVVSAATGVASAAVNVGGEVVGDAGCALKYGADFAGQLSAAASASASVSVSVSASASVSSSAGAG